MWAILLPALCALAWVGAFFAWCARARVRAEGAWPTASVLIVSLYAAIIAAPCVAYLYLSQPDWALLYLVPADRIPPLFVVPLLALAAAAVLGGFYVSARIMRSERWGRHHVRIVAGSGALVLLLSIAAAGRLGRVGTYDEFHTGEALPLGAVKLGYVLVALLVGLAAGAGYTAWELHRDARRATLR